jgi:ornithine cyclodeaminase
MEICVLRGEEVRALLPMRECIDLMRATMVAVSEGRAVIPLRTVLRMPGDIGMMGNMSGYLAEPECFGVKLVSMTTRNHGTPFPSHLGLVLLFETGHGQPVALLDASEITAIRTAAASGLATALLAREDAGDLAILGSGTQARSHLEAMLAVRPIRRVRVWSHRPESAARYAEEQSARFGISVEPMDNVESAVAGADLICTTSRAPEPVLFDEWVSDGAHLNLVGSSVPTDAEVDTALVRRARYFVDLRASTVNEGGEYLRALREGAITPDHILGEIGEVAADRLAGRTGSNEVTAYKSLGIAAQDIAAAHFVTARAKERGIGQTVEF